MVKIKMHAMYDHFPDLNPTNRLEPYIECYSDMYVFECTKPGANIAMLLEPRSMIEKSYEYVYEHPDYFRYIFTHDSQLLTLPNARMLNWADVWLTTDSEKNMGISLVTSPKDWCPLHHARLELYNYFKEHGGVDCFYGDWNNSDIPSIKPEDYLEHYKFSIVIENDIDDFWYTEKILNCFATKTVPIYVGARKISERFNPAGIINLDDWNDIPSMVNFIYKTGPDAFYNNPVMQYAIEDNFYRCVPYKISWKDRFIHDYGQILEEMMP